MTKRRSLADSIKSSVKGGGVPAEPAEEEPVAVVLKAAKGNSRSGKSFIGGYFAPEVAKQMKILAAENDTTIQDLTAEALNHLFAAHGKAEIAPVKE